MNLEAIKAAVKELNEIDKSQYPVQRIDELLRVVNKIAVIDYRLHPGKKVLRARPEDGLWPYTTRASHSYKPQEFNKTFQRASTPNRTMFYGSIIPEELDQNDLDNERVVVTKEALKWIRDVETCGVKRIAYSRWEVVEDIRLLAIMQHEDFLGSSSHTRKIMQDFNKFIEEHPEHRESSIFATSYIANEFAKEQTPEDYDYLTSAIFTEQITAHGFDGVLYPSVRMRGQGFNIAITPQAADNKLKLVAAGECTIYKHFERSVIENNTQAIIADDSKPFELAPVRAPYNAGENACLAELGLTSLDQLCIGQPNPAYKPKPC